MRLHVLSSLVAIAVLLSFPGCGNKTDPGEGALGSVKAGLEAVPNCPDLKNYVMDVITAEIDKAMVYYNGGKDVPMAMASTDRAAAEDGQNGGADGNDSPTPPASPENDGGTYTDSPKGTPEHSNTNTQEQGVDEADIVKSDGNYIYVLSGRHLRIAKSHPAADTALVGGVDIGPDSFELFVNGDTALVYSRAYGQGSWGDEMSVGGGSSSGNIPPTASSGSAASTPSTDPAPDPDEPGAEKPGNEAALADLRGPLTRMTVVDLSDRSNPQITRTIVLEGQYLSSRMVGKQVVTVSRGHLFVPTPGTSEIGSSGGDIAIANDPGSTEATDAPVSEDGDNAGSAPAPPPLPGKADVWVDEKKPDFDALKKAYLADIQGQKVEEWLPQMIDIAADGTSTSQLLAPCSNFYKPSFLMGLNLVSVISLDLSSPNASLTTTTTLGEASIVYASKQAIYCAAYVYDYWYWSDQGDKDTGEFSAVHKFSYGDGGITYEGSGKVPGKILNQFSLSEHEGHLRLATTIQNWATNGESSNGIYVMKQSDNALELVGKVDNLALGERIYSARFIGDKGYVVTFKNTDPLFTLDLSVPNNPLLMGELKIPGFSTYIHPMGSDHLLTIGREAEDNGQWVQVQGLQVQIFDVSDLSAPKLAHKATLGKSGIHSEALYEHKAFAYFAKLDLLAIPYRSYGGVSEGGGDVGIPEPGTSDGSDDSEPSPPPENPTEQPVEPETNDSAPQAPEIGVMVFKVNATDGISEHGVIDHQSLAANANQDWWNRLQIRRTLLIEDKLYTVGTAGIKVNAAADLSTIAEFAFPEDDLCGGWDYCGSQDDNSRGEPSAENTPTPAESDSSGT